MGMSYSLGALSNSLAYLYNACPVLSAYGSIAQHFRPRRHLYSAPVYRQEMSERLDTWLGITSCPTAG
jgi:hypothetical protein